MREQQRRENAGHHRSVEAARRGVNTAGGRPRGKAVAQVALGTYFHGASRHMWQTCKYLSRVHSQGIRLICHGDIQLANILARFDMAAVPHVVILTSSGLGHVLPASELAKRLAVHHGFTITMVTYASLSSPGHSSPLASLPPGVSVAALPEVSLDDLPADAHLVTRILTVITRALPALRDLLRSLLHLPAGITAFVTDMLCPAALAVGKEMGLPG
uniref:Hydroquinone glucosyltransferase n=1 Tax=Aegilops tauschii TaxID=37682 RepID=M8BU40_AEGTA